METFAAVIDSWPTVVAFATDTGTDLATAYKWKQRNRIPAKAWGGVIAAAKRRKIKGVTADRFILLAEQGPE